MDLDLSDTLVQSNGMAFLMISEMPLVLVSSKERSVDGMVLSVIVMYAHFHKSSLCFVIGIVWCVNVCARACSRMCVSCVSECARVCVCVCERVSVCVCVRVSVPFVYLSQLVYFLYIQCLHYTSCLSVDYLLGAGVLYVCHKPTFHE
jgi:hypothetical protein